MLVDSHCHLDFPELFNELDDIVARAHANGIAKMVTICTRVRKFEQVLAAADRFDQIYCTVGTHPHNAQEELDVSVEEIVEIAKNPKVVGIGEAGLDFYYDNSPRDAQEISFRRQIEAARRTGLPLVIHSRDADEVMMKILEEEMGKGAFKFLLHCFSSSAALAHKGVELGGYISFSGILTFNKAVELRQIAYQIPLDRLLVETDAPFLAPVPHRGKRNEPAFTRDTAIKLAEIRGLSLEEIASLTGSNFHTLFSRVPSPKTENA